MFQPMLLTKLLPQLPKKLLRRPLSLLLLNKKHQNRNK